MTDTNKQILDLIMQNKSMIEICNDLNISEKQLYVRIKQIINEGYNIKKDYMYDSNIYYKIQNEFRLKVENSIRINLSKKENNFKCLVISDMHIGNIDSNIKLTNYVYEYAVKNNIHYILNCGDTIEGDYTTSKKNIKEDYIQVDTFLKKYPYDRSIKNIMIFGNHDHHSLIENGFDISKKIKNARYDMIPIGYGQGSVNIKSDSLLLFHKLNESYKPKTKNEKIILSGHGHMMKTKLKDELWLCIPTLSNVTTDRNVDILPGFVELNINIEDGKFEYVEAKHLIITPKIIKASESRCRIKRLNKFN